MSDLAQLRGLVDQFPPPDLDDLVRVSARRRRRTRAAGVVAGAVLVSSVVALVAGVGDAPRTSDPVHPPEPAPTWGKHEWPPERVRAEGSGREYRFAGDTASGMQARMWEVCLRPERCRRWTPGQERHAAVELSVDGFRTSSLFGLTRSIRDPRSIYLEPVDEDTVLAVDVARPGMVRERYRLLDVTGTQQDLQLVPGTTPAAPGPDVVLPLGRPVPYRVDAEEGIVQQLDTPLGAWMMWAPDQDDVLWGVDPGCDVHWLDEGGTWRTHEVRCRGASPVFADPVPEGLMVLELHGGPAGGVSRVVSRDGGASWTRYGPDVDLATITAE